MAISQYGATVVLQNNSGSAAASAAPVGAVNLFASGSSGSAKLYMNVEGSQTDKEVAADLTISDGVVTDDVVLSSDTLKLTGSVNAISASVSNNQVQFHLDIAKMTATTTVDDADLVVIDDGANGTMRKMTRAHFIESAALDNINIDGGAIDGTAIGANSQAAGKFTTLSGSSTLNVVGASTFGPAGLASISADGVMSGSGVQRFHRATFDRFAVASADINGGAMDGTVIGAASQAAAEFTTVSGSGNFSVGGTLTSAGNILPLSDGAYDLGASGTEFKDLYIDGVAYVDSLQADELGAALDANNQAITNINVDSGAVDGITLGTNSAVSNAVMTILTASHAQITNLDVVTVNSVSQTETTLEISDKLIVASLSASSANSDGGGLRIGGGAEVAGNASLLWDHSNSALDFNIGGTTEMRLADGVLRPETDNDVDLGASGAQFKDLYINGAAYIDQLGEALDANDQAITNINVDSGAIDGTVIGANSQAAGEFTTVSGSGNFSVGGTVTSAGNILPLSDGAVDLGSSSKEFKDLYIDGVAYIDDLRADALGAALDCDSQAMTNINVDSGAIDGTVIGANSQAAGEFTTLSGSSTLNVVGASTFGPAGLASISAAGVMSGSGVSTFHRATLDRVQVAEADINGGAIDGTTVGASSQAAGKFTTLSGSGLISAGGNISMTNGALLMGLAAGGYGIGNASGQSVMGISSGQNAVFSANASVTNQLSAESVVVDDGYGSAGATIAADGSGSFAGDLLVGTAGSENGGSATFHGAATGEKAFYSSYNNVFQVTGSAASGLQVSIGGDASSEFAIDVANGSNNNNKIRAAAFVTYSDESLKSDVTSMANTALDTVMSLEGVEFTWKDSGQRDFGFIAQDVQSVLPQAVHTTQGVSGVDYSRLSSVLVEAVKAQQVQIQDLKETIAKLKK
jgi:hypothetical protein